MKLAEYAKHEGKQTLRIRAGKKNYVCNVIEALAIFGNAEIIRITNKSGAPLLTIR